MNKIEIARELKNVLENVKCEDCPLNDACDVVDEETNQGCLCTILKNESEEK